METKKILREQRDIAEKKSIIYRNKLNKIENIIRIQQCQKTPSIIILEKIKEVINSMEEN